jgi:hypothetical protein
MLELIDIINILNDPVHSRFKALDVNVIFTDSGARCFNQLQHFFLSSPQIIHSEPKLTVHNIESFELVVHIIRLFFKFIDFGFSRRDVSFQVFDSVVKHKFELFELLSFLFKLVYNFFSFTDLSIFFMDLGMLLAD